MSCLMEFSMSPLDKGASVGEYVARSLDIIDRSGIDYRLNAMGTILEGEFADCLAVVQQCYDRMREDCTRITCSIKIDAREGQSGRLDAKIDSIRRRLGRDPRT
ncbi:MAG: MTH1187 family thiamine-binding protein [Phycisphaerales bacterium]|nr:MTH1187 family thiamine-binding protein [Phycisphaerales bacterium]